MDPRYRNVIIIVVVVGLIVAGIGAYYVLKKASTSACGPSETTTICIDQSEIPDSLDPAVTFTTPGWAAVQQVYQGLVNYNGSSATNFSGVLAKNWTESPDGMHWNFTMWPGEHFSNGDQINAYVMWYSLYRSLLLEQGPQFILEQNFFSTGLTAYPGLNYTSPVNEVDAANQTLVTYLNAWNFDTPTANEISLMELSNQSFQVINNLTIELNLGFGYYGPVPYTYLLASISAPNSYAVDPVLVDAKGGVTVGAVNTYLASNTLGSGQYILEDYNGVAGGGYTLKPDPNYWGTAAAKAQPWNVMLQPANTTILVIFQDSVDITTNDLITGAVQEASFAYIGPSTITQLQGHSNVVVQPLPTIYGATSGSWWVYLNSSYYPLNNLSVRAAIAHAIDYSTIIQQAFGGYATQWVGPVPPSYPYYNPAALAPYSYDLSLAQAEIADSPCAGGACTGTVLNYAYLSSGLDWSETAQFLRTELSQIGITINPVPVSLDNLLVMQTFNGNGQCIAQTSAYGGPFPMGQEFYTSDYISPDDWTQNDALSTGSANQCMAGYSNGTMDTDVYAAAANSTPSALTAYYTNMTNLLYYNYSEIWLVVPTSFAVYASDLHGFVQNPMASAEPFALLFNTQYLT